MKLVDPSHPFFAPLWRRVATVTVTLAWAVLEFATGSPFWGILFGALGLYCLYVFLIAYGGPDDSQTNQDDGGQT